MSDLSSCNKVIAVLQAFHYKVYIHMVFSNYITIGSFLCCEGVTQRHFRNQHIFSTTHTLSAYHVPGARHGAGNAMINNSDGHPAFRKLRAVEELDIKKAI